MKYLLDVNVLLAWGWADHSDHQRAGEWVSEIKRTHGTLLLTSAISELGFVRVSVQRSGGGLSVDDAAFVLKGMLGSLGRHHSFVPDVISSIVEFPNWCDAASRTTDAHLMMLAEHHGAVLATLDTGIPRAFLLPRAG